MNDTERKAKIRKLILDTIRANGGGMEFEPLTVKMMDEPDIDQLTNDIAATVRASLGFMARDNLVEKRRNTWYVCGPVTPPTTNGPRPSGTVAAAVQGRVELPAFQQKRDGRTITLESTPALLDNVFSVELKLPGGWFPVPLFQDMRICIGPERPRWSPEQTTFSGVTLIKVVFKNGQTAEYPINDNSPVTVAPLPQ